MFGADLPGQPGIKTVGIGLSRLVRQGFEHVQISRGVGGARYRIPVMLMTLRGKEVLE